MQLRSLQALCLVNFFMADVRDGLGPFLGIFLTERHWNPADIGWVMTAGGLAGLLATLPAGVATDATRHKRSLLLAGTILITCATLMLWYFPQGWITMLSQVITGLSAALIAPVLTGVTLGLTGPEKFGHQMGKNEAFNHAGNMSAALIAGASVWYWGIGAVFVLMTAMALLAGMAVLAIRSAEIDDVAARGLTSASSNSPIPRLSQIARHPAIIITALTLLLFHLGNAALLPMLSLRVASMHNQEISPGLYAAATVVISQCVMIPVALFAAKHATRYGYATLITLALLMLPLRALIASAFDSTYSMVPVQILDGIAAGLLGVSIPGYIVKVLQGSGHTNAGQGFIMLMQGIGASLSPALAGNIAAAYSYRATFAVLAVIACAALVTWWMGSRRADNYQLS